MPEPPRYALVTGAASGLGRALAVALARQRSPAGEPWHIAICDIDAVGSDETLKLVVDAGGTGQVEPLDVTRAEDWQAVVARLSATWPSLDLLINNAGVAVSGDVGTLSLDDWRWSLEVNLHGVINGCHACVPWLKRNSSGAHLVNIASVAAFASAPTMAAYNVAKAGVVALSETLHAELSSSNVGVTVVMPGFFATKLLTRGRLAEESHREFVAKAMDRASFSADDVATATLRAIERRKLYVMLPRRARWLWRLKRLFPQAFMRLVARIYRLGDDKQSGTDVPAH
jgi:NAD(P)-dependent dehydrogenase (short-subunit alcohol dehydrogenase family)